MVTSLVGGTGIPGMHKPVLDIDMPVRVEPSSTPGHFHLYIDRAMYWDQLRQLLDALHAAGILEKGYVEASKRRRYTAVRLPGVTKGDDVVGPLQAPPDDVPVELDPAADLDFWSLQET